MSVKFVGWIELIACSVLNTLKISMLHDCTETWIVEIKINFKLYFWNILFCYTTKIHNKFHFKAFVYAKNFRLLHNYMLRLSSFFSQYSNRYKFFIIDSDIDRKTFKHLNNFIIFFQTAIFTVVLLPFRVMVICYLLVTAWFLACIGLYGLTEQDLRSKPMTGWRRSVIIKNIYLLYRK